MATVTIESNNLDLHLYASPMGRHIFREGDGSGDLWIIYCRGGNVYVRKSTDNGSTWESTIVGYTATGASDYAVESAMVYDSGNSRVYAIYHTRPEEKLYARSFNVTTETWNADQTELTGIITPIWNIVIDRDNSGRLWVGYVKYLLFSSSSPTCTYYIRRSTNVNDITAWGVDVNLGNSGGFDGFGQLRVNCRGVTDDKVLVTYFKYTAAFTYKLYSRLNDGLGDGAGNWAVEQDTVATVYGTELNSGIDDSHFCYFRINPFFWTVRLVDGTVYLLSTVTNTIYCQLFDWGIDTWTGKANGVVGSSSGYLCGSYGGAITIRAFVGVNVYIRYIDYTIGTNVWGSVSNLVVSEKGYCLTCTDGFTTLNDNRVLFQTIDNYALP